ncbi:Molybdenum cofactor biosynthesis protein A [Paragonimus heterotremus]|uniref:Molybdenum cofactor biosynthesis protein A n=1 Tax=Paragonimus heterotremus TaxID=100268 RepID=A0A8J4T1X5_9TREM|nr:Molybdenum cofactor biosynthesis protein A [Paragonimus heterotremus]
MFKDLPEIITSLDHLRTSDKNLQQICMTSNGVGFTRKASLLRKCGLDSVTVSLDSLNPTRVKQLTGYPVYKQAFGAIYAALENGFDPVKVNCVLIRGFNDDEICDFVQLTENLPIEVRFIEYMPFGGNKWDQKKLVSYDEMMDQLRTNFPLIRRIATESSSTAKMYQIENWPGKVGFITSMTNNFCSGCTRLRLTADGHLKPCLHGTDEVDLVSVLRKANLRAEDLQSTSLCQRLEHEQESSNLYSAVKELNILVDAALNRKAKEHSGMHELARGGNRPMVRIGG